MKIIRPVAVLSCLFFVTPTIQATPIAFVFTAESSDLAGGGIGGRLGNPSQPWQDRAVVRITGDTDNVVAPTDDLIWYELTNLSGTIELGELGVFDVITPLGVRVSQDRSGQPNVSLTFRHRSGRYLGWFETPLYEQDFKWAIQSPLEITERFGTLQGVGVGNDYGNVLTSGGYVFTAAVGNNTLMSVSATLVPSPPGWIVAGGIWALAARRHRSR